MLALGLAWLGLPAAAFDFAGLKPQGYVSDFARVLDPAARRELDNYAKQLQAATGVELALVTIDTLGGEPVEDVANDIFRKWGIGKKGKDEGILLLLITRDRRSRLEVGRGLEPVIPDGFAGSILRQMRPALREQHYADALRTAAQSLGSRIAEAKNVRLDAQLPTERRRRQEPAVPWLAIAAGVLALPVVLGLFGRRARRFGGHFFPAWIMSDVLSRSWQGDGSHGRGGFGGYDSSDSFGGFGGGDSGGGGASSDW